MAAAPLPFQRPHPGRDAAVRHLAVHPARARLHRAGALPVPALHRLPQPRRPAGAGAAGRPRAAGARSAPATATAEHAERTPMTGVGTATSRSTGQTQEPRAGHAGLRDHLLGLEPDRAAGRALHRASSGSQSTQKSLLVAMPVLVGSLGRIPAGALTDRFGGRLMFTVLSSLAIAPFVLLVALAGNRDSYALLLVVRLLPRHRRHDVRGRHPVRQRVVRAAAARLRHRRLRRGHGRHGAVGVLHPAVRRLVRLHRRPT